VTIRVRFPSAIFLPLAAVAAVTALACQSPPVETALVPPTEPRNADTVVLDAAALKRAGLVVDTVRLITRVDAAESPGIVALNETRTARIGALAEGIVVDMNAQVGDRVRAHQQLASMHGHSVHDAWAGYRKAKSEERRLAVELRYASEAQARVERLYADKAVPLQDVQRAQANRVAAEESLEIGRTEVRRAEEELEHLGITNGDDPTGERGEQIPVKTPFAGVVLERLVTQGTTVTPGAPLFVVSDLSTVWVLAELDEAHLAGARVGRTASVRVAAYPSDVFQGKVTHVGETVNPKTRRVTIRCEVPNADGRLKPEMYATVQVGESESRPILAVPSSALQNLGGQPSVFADEGDGRFRLRPIEAGPERDGLIEVRRGLNEGDRIVTEGAFILKSELLKGPDSGE
jgi:membrane fusion protein, heavy metal efflux system